MSRRIALSVLAALSFVGLSCGSGTSSASESVDIGAGLQGSATLTASQYASGLTHVSALAFDSSGNLWVSTASYDDDGTDAVYMVSSPGETPASVIEDVHTPLGLLWIGDEFFVASAARVDAYSGFDGTSFTSSRTVVELDAAVGEVNSLALSPSGRIVLGISSPCDACTPTDEDSAAIVSFLPDGSDLQVYASDIRAAVGLVFYPGTDTLFATMNQRDDLGDATPGDWLSVVEEGQSWGFPDCYGQGGADCASQPTPVAVLDAHAAVSGVAIVTGELGDAVGTSAIVAEWVHDYREEVKNMKSSLRKYVAAGVLAGAIGIGGAAVASAAAPTTSDDSSTTVVTTATDDTATTPAAATDDPNCPGMGGSGGPGAPAPASTPTPAADSNTVDTSTVDTSTV